LTIIAFPLTIAFSYPIATMIFISIYKQLMANADERFNDGLHALEEQDQGAEEGE